MHHTLVYNAIGGVATRKQAQKKDAIIALRLYDFLHIIKFILLPVSTIY